jgi:HEAT repeat protein
MCQPFVTVLDVHFWEGLTGLVPQAPAERIAIALAAVEEKVGDFVGRSARMLRSYDSGTRQTAADALRGLSAARLAPHVAQFIQAHRDRRLTEAQRIGLDLIRMVGLGAIPSLLEALLSEKGGVRLGAIAALAMFGPEAIGALPALKEVAGIRSSRVRAAVAAAIAQISPGAGPAMGALEAPAPRI